MPVDIHTDSILDGGSIPPGSTVTNPNKENEMKYGLTFIGGIVFTALAAGVYGDRMAEALDKLTKKIEAKK